MDPARAIPGETPVLQTEFLLGVVAAHPLGRVRQMSNIANLALESAELPQCALWVTQGRFADHLR